VSDGHAPDPGGREAACEPARARRGRRSFILATAGLAAVAAVAVGLLVSGFRTTKAHTQPMADRPFSVAPRVAARLPGPPALRTPQPGSIDPACAPGSFPSQVDIPSLCLYVPMVDTHMDGASLLIPGDVRDVGLDTDSAPLSSPVGTTIIAGHIDDARQGDGSFYFLSTARAGASVTVVAADGSKTEWKVTAVTSVPKADLPRDIFDVTGARRLVLVTCGGALLGVPGNYSYADNTLVYATPAT